MITGKNYIGTNLVAGGTKVLKTFNPELNQENSWDFIEATTEEIEQAVQLANKAYQEYKNVSGKRKALFLNAIADEILALGDTLLEVYVQESGLPRGRAEGERGRTIGQLRAFAQMLEEGSWVEATIDTAIPDRQPLPKIDLRKMLYPLGPVVVFGSSNFPFAFSTAGGDTASALAAGCPVIVKSHSMHIGTGEMIASAVIKAVQKTGMPEGVFSNLIGEGTALGTILVKHPLVKAVGFTGSIAGGRALFDLASQRSEPIPVFAEMGSINPVVLLPNELRNNTSFWAKQYASSITLGTGQFCTNPGLIIGLESPELNSFASELASEILQIAPSCMLHYSIRKNYDEGQQELSLQKGVEILAIYEGKTKPNYAPQTVLRVNATEFLKNKTLSHEVFGPFSVLVVCETKEQMAMVINSLEGQLTGTIIAESKELSQYREVVEALKGRVGRLIFNCNSHYFT